MSDDGVYALRDSLKDALDRITSQLEQIADRLSGSRGTLTILPDGKVIVGVPTGQDLTPDLLDRIAESAERWRLDPKSGIEVFAWPVDVVDLRDE